MKSDRRTKPSARAAAMATGILILLGLLSSATNPPITTTESFDTTTYRAPGTVDGWGSGRVVLNKKINLLDKTASRTANLYTDAMPPWADSVAAADFTGDGKTDIIATSSRYANALALFQNTAAAGSPAVYNVVTLWIDGCAGTSGPTGVPTLGIGGAAIDPSGYCGLASGDYDGDGDIDFIYLCSQASSPYTPKRIFLYSNRRVDSGNLIFDRYDVTAAWAPILGGAAWTSGMMATCDFFQEGNLDILIGTVSGDIYIATNLGDGVLDEESFYLEETPVLSTGFTGRGVSAIGAADFDLDGDIDIVAGSVSSSELRYYANNGVGDFALAQTFKDTRSDPTDNEFDGAAVAIVCSDLDNDGDVGFLVATDGANYRPSGKYVGGTVFYFDNRAGTFVITFRLDTRLGNESGTPWTQTETEQGFALADFDYAAALDFNGDGLIDTIAFGNHAYSLGAPEGTTTSPCLGLQMSTSYNLNGQANSLVFAPEVRSYNRLVTKVVVKDIYQGYVGSKNNGLKIEYFVSNTNGLVWHPVGEFHDAELKNKLGKVKDIKFKEFGSELVWKAVFTAAEDSGSGASIETPYIDSISFEYTTLDGKEFSRTSPVATRIRDAERHVKHVTIAASFLYPSFEGHLRAYDVTRMNFPGAGTYTLRTVSRSNPADTSGREIIPEDVSVLWDAGEVLKTRSASSRMIYTAIPGGHGGPELVRTDFTSANSRTLKKYIKDTGTHDGSLIEFIRGEDRPWKLGWIDHSTPLLVGPPSGVEALKGAGYEAFAGAHAERQDVVYVGDNGGMLHCFSTSDGEELWGFVPYNQLSFLKKLAKKDHRTHSRFFSPSGLVLVDGAPAVEDVYIDRDGDGTKEWITLLVSGQGKGTGKGTKAGNYHYFALDVTDPEDPQPLWEFSTDKHGETWSVPFITKVIWQGAEKWVAFLGTGKKAKDSYIYAVDCETGNSLWSGKLEGTDVPCSPNGIDIDNNGTTDRAYVGDLKGNMWRVNAAVNPWTLTKIFNDKKDHAILTKPEIYLNRTAGETTPHLYFGTGGSDDAPDGDTYHFVALVDASTPRVEWYLGNKADITVTNNLASSGALAMGEKIWADPVLVDGVIYFSTFMGNIEDVEPLSDEVTPGYLYARWVVAAPALVGKTAFSGAETYLTLASKTRSAVAKGEVRKADDGTTRTDIWVNEYDSTLQVVSISGELQGAGNFKLKIRSWREIYRIIR